MATYPSSLGTTTPIGNSLLTIQATTTDSILATLRGFAGQVANLFQVQDSSGVSLFNIGINGLTLGSLNGPLQANAGLVSATTSIGVLYGGTGLTATPSFGQILRGTGSGYTLVATSTLGVDLSDTTGTLAVSRGGTGVTSWSQGWLFSSGDGTALSASTSPTVNYITATSTTATSTFAHGVAINSGGLKLATLTSCNNLGTDSAGNVNCQLGQQSLDVRKSADESLTSNAVLQDDDELLFAIGANETWVFQLNLIYTTLATPDIQIAVTAPSGATCDYAGGGIDMADGAGSTTCGGAVAVTGGSATANSPLYVYGAIVNGSTAGTVRLQWAQNTSNSNTTTIHQGSSVSAFRVSGGADVAEVYYSKDISLVPGTVVAPDVTLPNGVRLSQKGDDALGIISTRPGLVIGDIAEAHDGRPVMVALAGRVPARVTLQNGPIAVGDYLMSSDMPGVAMKATQSGMVLGQALSSFDGGSGSDVGMVIMFVKNHYHQSNPESASAATIDIVRNETQVNAFTAISNFLSSGVKLVTDFVSARVTAIRGYFEEVFAKKVHTEELCIKKSDGTEVCVNGNQLQTILNAGSTSSTAAVAPSIGTVAGAGIGAGEAADTEAPVITIVGNNPANIAVGDAYIDLGATVSDNISQNLGTQSTGEVIDTNVPGSYTVTYTATDQAGNTATTTRNVQVQPQVGEEVEPEPVKVSTTSATSTPQTPEPTPEPIPTPQPSPDASADEVAPAEAIATPEPTPDHAPPPPLENEPLPAETPQ